MRTKCADREFDLEIETAAEKQAALNLKTYVAFLRRGANCKKSETRTIRI